MSRRNVVITGAAINSPHGDTLAGNFDAVWNGRSNFTEITESTGYNAQGSAVRYSGECRTVDIKRLPDRKVQKIIRRKDVVSLITILKAADHAKLGKGSYNPERTGMYVGAASTQIGDLSPYFHLVETCVDLKNGVFDSKMFGENLLNLVNPLIVLQNLMNNSLCYGTKELDARGVNANFMDFQISGLRAIGEGFRSLSLDRADVVVAGGLSSPVEPFHVAEGVRAGSIAKTADLAMPCSQVVRPYDKTRFGTILSEGSAYVVLEDEMHAKGRHADVLGRVLGFGLSADGRMDYLNETSSPGLVRAANLALEDAGLRLSDIGLIVGHGNGARAADAAEGNAYRELLGELDIPIASPKASLGEMSEASGSVALLLATEALKRGGVFPTANFQTPDLQMTHLSISSQTQPLQKKTALVTARSLVGISACVVVCVD